MQVDQKKYPFTYDGLQYAIRVREGKEVVGNYIKLYVNRFFKDIENTKKKDAKYLFSLDKAEHYLSKAQKFKHAKGGNWKTETITYEPWQNFLFAYLLGFLRVETKRRRFRTAYIEIGRGNTKSTMSSQLGLYFTSIEGENGAEVVCASTKKDAARIVFDASRVMALKNPSFLKATGTRVLAHTIIHPSTHSVMKPIASESKNLDGLNPSLIIGDETHQWDRKLYDVLDSSLTKRDNSLFCMISTAGLSTEGIGHELHCYTAKVLSGEMEDDTWFGCIYAADKDDHWLDINTWKKANPNWGVSVDPINFEAKAKKAQETPASKYNFLVKHLNVWQNTHTQFFSLDHWDKCADPTLDINNFNANHCWKALDLASKIDLAADITLFKKENKYYLFSRAYLPEARLMDGKNVKYAEWADKGYLTIMEGETINFEKIQNQIIEDSGKFKIIGVNADPWSANETIQRLLKAGIDTYEFRMTTGNLSEPMKKLDALIREGNFIHDGSPLVRWCLGNVVAKEDANGNVFPRKSHERLKIDPIVGIIMALAGFIREEKENPVSVYEERGILTL